MDRYCQNAEDNNASGEFDKAITAFKEIKALDTDRYENRKLNLLKFFYNPYRIVRSPKNALLHTLISPTVISLMTAISINKFLKMKKVSNVKKLLASLPTFGLSYAISTLGLFAYSTR